MDFTLDNAEPARKRKWYEWLLSLLTIEQPEGMSDEAFVAMLNGMYWH